MDKINRIVMQGTVIGINGNKKEMSVRIATDGNIPFHRRKEEGEEVSRYSGETQYPTIIFPSSASLGGVSVREHVRITAYGEIIYHENKDGTQSTQLILKGETITKAKRPLANYCKDIPPELCYDGGNPEDMNVALLCGTITNVHKVKNSLTVLTLDAPVGDMHIPVTASCFGPMCSLASEFREGDNAAILGYVRTARKQTSKHPVRYSTRQNIICTDIFAY